MIKLIDVKEENIKECLKLKVKKEQRRFLDSPRGIIDRAFLYREQNVKLKTVEYGGKIAGLILVRDLLEEPKCYDLQQFMIDEDFQSKGIGSEALYELIKLLIMENRFNRIDVCIDKNNVIAIKLFKSKGFLDTGYIDEEIPNCINLSLTIDIFKF